MILAGCADAPPAPQPDAEGPIELDGRRGLLLVDLEARTATSFAERALLAWMSENATIITWAEDNFALVAERTTGARTVGPLTVWARVHEDATGLQLEERAANLRYLANGTLRASTPVQPPPLAGVSWTAASADLRVLGGEYAVSGRQGCSNDIVLLDERVERTVGCHLEIARDGRAAWTEATLVRLRGTDGTISNLTGPGTGNRANNTFVSHENPIFTAEGTLLLRVTGGATRALTEIVTTDGNVLAKLEGPRHLAMHDASADGRFVLVSAFDP